MLKDKGMLLALRRSCHQKKEKTKEKKKKTNQSTTHLKCRCYCDAPLTLLIRISHHAVSTTL